VSHLQHLKRVAPPLARPDPPVCARSAAPVGLALCAQPVPNWDVTEADARQVEHAAAPIGVAANVVLRVARLPARAHAARRLALALAARLEVVARLRGLGVACSLRTVVVVGDRGLQAGRQPWGC
jgi:hypothetical protein